MALTVNKSGNSLFIQETATWSTGKAIGNPNIRIIGIIASSNHASNIGVIELAHNNTARSYPTTYIIRAKAAESSIHLNMSIDPMVFTDGIWLKSIEYMDITLILDNNSKRE